MSGKDLIDDRNRGIGLVWNINQLDLGTDECKLCPRPFSLRTLFCTQRHSRLQLKEGEGPGETGNPIDNVS